MRALLFASAAAALAIGCSASNAPGTGGPSPAGGASPSGGASSGMTTAGSTTTGSTATGGAAAGGGVSGSPGAPTIPADPFHGIPAAPTDSACHPLSTQHCFLPYPSNWFTARDTASPTGMRLRLPRRLLPDDVARELLPTYLPDALTNGQEGFQTSGPILFELPRALRPDSLPEDGGGLADVKTASVVVFDLQTGVRVPIRTERSDYASSFSVREKRYLLQVFPRSRFDFGHHYVAVVTDNLKPEDARGGGYEIPKLWTTPGSPEAAYHEPLLAFLEARGIGREHVVAVTDFTTRTEADATGRILRMMRAAYDQEHPIRNVRVSPSIHARTDAMVEGEIRLSDFRDERGDIDELEVHGRENWVPFVLAIPDAAKDHPVPVAIYGHALMADRNLLLGLVVPTNSARGWATVAIDQPNHGARADHDGGHIATLMAPKHVPRLVGQLAQAPIDQVSLLKALRSSFATIDAAPRGLLRYGDGKPDLDASRVIYQGTSLGGVLGSAFVGGACALGLDLKGAYLQVSGAGMINTLVHSTLWTGLYSNIIPRTADGAEALWMLSVVGQRIERGDALPLAHRIDRPLVLSYGLDDEVVTNRATLALAELAKVPVVNAVLRGKDVEHLDYVGIGSPRNTPRNGWALQQLRIKRTGVVPLDLETHLTFLDSSAQELLDTWLEGF